MDLAADLALFYADFGTPAAHTPAGGVASDPQLVIIDRNSGAQLGGDIIMGVPTVQYPLASFTPPPVRGDTFTIGAEVWRITEAPQVTNDGLEAIAPVTRIA